MAKIAIGTNPGQMAYRATDEVLESPGAPFVDSQGRLVFYKVLGGKAFLVVDHGTITELPYQGNLSWFRETGSRNFSSQQGLVLDTTPLIFSDDRLWEYTYQTKGITLFGPEYHLYPAPFGALIYSEQERAGLALVIDLKNPREDFSIIDQTRLGAWLPAQPGGFSLGRDGLLYRNGVVWSIRWPRVFEGMGMPGYLGRLLSGHTLWQHSDSEGRFAVSVANPDRELEVTLSIPLNSYSAFSIGPWGELYFLIAPQYRVEGAGTKSPNVIWEGESELVVVRNHLKFFGRLTDGGVRLRKAPSTTGEILGTYPNKTGFRILETGTQEETIGGQKNVWYKVRLLDGKEGWFFGSFVRSLYDGPNGNPPPWPNVPDW